MNIFLNGSDKAIKKYLSWVRQKKIVSIPPSVPAVGLPAEGLLTPGQVRLSLPTTSTLPS